MFYFKHVQKHCLFYTEYTEYTEQLNNNQWMSVLIFLNDNCSIKGRAQNKSHKLWPVFDYKNVLFNMPMYSD